MNLFESKFGLLALFLIVFFLYFPINRKIRKGHCLKTNTDDLIPFIPFFSIFYIGVYVLAISFMTIAFGKSLIEFKQFIFALSLAGLISYLIFILFPTSIDRPEIKAKGFFNYLVKLIYKLDKPYNVFPSGHAFYTTIFMLFFTSWYPNFGFIFLLTAILILMSAILIKQHHLLDMFGGIILGNICYLLSLFLIK